MRSAPRNRLVEPKERGPNAVLLGAVLVLELFSGCMALPVPVNHHQRESRKNVNAEEAGWLIPGETTRHEALLRLGEPDAATTNDSQVAYSWRKTRLHLWIVVSTGYLADGGRADFGRDYSLQLSFDPQGTLQSRDLHRSKLRSIP